MEKEEYTIEVSAEAADIAKDALVSYIVRKLSKNKKEQVIATFNACALLGACAVNALIAGGSEKDKATNGYIALLKDHIETLEEHGKEL